MRYLKETLHLTRVDETWIWGRARAEDEQEARVMGVLSRILEGGVLATAHKHISFHEEVEWCRKM